MLTDSKIAASQPMPKPYKLYDAMGLFLLINSNGSKYWRYSYTYNKKQNAISLGVYPSITLAKARAMRDDAKDMLGSGIDPAQMRRDTVKAEKAAEAATFLAVSEEWIANQSKYLSDSTMSKIKWMLNSFVYPKLGDKPVSDITPMDLLEVLRTIESKGHHETAARTRHRVGTILRYAIATGRDCRDVSADLKGALVPFKGRHHAAITEPTELAKLLRSIDQYQGSDIIRGALKLSPLLLCRPGELRHMEWDEISLDTGEWRIPEHKMKMKRPHIVPLASQALDILKCLHPITAGYGRYVLPNRRGTPEPMVDGAVRKALARMGYPNTVHTAHGFRATARTILDEVLGYRPDWIEAQLAHEVRDSNGRAYNRTAYLPDRKLMMQKWADYLDTLKQGTATNVGIHSSVPGA